MNPNHAIEMNRHQSARFRLTCEGDPGRQVLATVDRRSVTANVGIDMSPAIFIASLLLLSLAGCSSKEVRGKSSDVIPYYVPANSNDVPTVQAEVDSPAFRAALARGTWVGRWRLRQLRISLGGGSSSWTWRTSRAVDDGIANALSSYLSYRADGHSSAYSRDAMFAAKVTRSEQWSFLDDVPPNRGRVPESWVDRFTTATNSVGERMVDLVVLDGELAWSCRLSYRRDGQFEYYSSMRRDALEFNPAYTNLLAEVERSVEQKMGGPSAPRPLGSCHTFWRHKKEMLKERGINWRSPPELNPLVVFD